MLSMYNTEIKWKTSILKANKIMHIFVQLLQWSVADAGILFVCCIISRMFLSRKTELFAFLSGYNNSGRTQFLILQRVRLLLAKIWRIISHNLETVQGRR